MKCRSFRVFSGFVQLQLLVQSLPECSGASNDDEVRDNLPHSPVPFWSNSLHRSFVSSPSLSLFMSVCICFFCPFKTCTVFQYRFLRTRFLLYRLVVCLGVLLGASLIIINPWMAFTRLLGRVNDGIVLSWPSPVRTAATLSTIGEEFSFYSHLIYTCPYRESVSYQVYRRLLIDSR